MSDGDWALMNLNDPSRAPAPKDKTIARSLGEFFGHIWKGVKTDPKAITKTGDGGVRVKVGERHEEEVRETPQGKVTIRRTIIEEVDLPRPEAGE